MTEAALGLAIGALLGLLGAGGSILAVPALVYGAGQPLAVAVPTSLLVVGISSATAALPRVRAGQVRWRIAAVVGATGAVAAFAGAALNRVLDPDVVLAGFAVVMVIAGLRMLRDQHDVGGDCALPSGGVNWRGCLPKSLAVGVAVGFLTGLFGVGGGFLLVPALTLLLGLPMPVAAGTSLLIVTLNSAAGYAAHAHDARSSGGLDTRTTVIFTATAVGASLLTARFAEHVSADRLKHWFAYFIFATAAFVAAQVIWT